MFRILKNLLSPSPKVIFVNSNVVDFDELKDAMKNLTGNVAVVGVDVPMGGMLQEHVTSV